MPVPMPPARPPWPAAAALCGLALALLIAGPRPAAAADPVPFEGGTYAIDVRLELPFLDDNTGRKQVRLCLDARGGGTHGLAVLSDNNPLARCPVSDVREEGGVLTFAIACEGRGAAQASARYELAPTAFRGRIAMRMGGKNMTMTEVQAGRRVGACAPDGTPAL